MTSLFDAHNANTILAQNSFYLSLWSECESFGGLLLLLLLLVSEDDAVLFFHLLYVLYSIKTFLALFFALALRPDLVFLCRINNVLSMHFLRWSISCFFSRCIFYHPLINLFQKQLTHTHTHDTQHKQSIDDEFPCIRANLFLFLKYFISKSYLMIIHVIKHVFFTLYFTRFSCMCVCVVSFLWENSLTLSLSVSLASAAYDISFVKAFSFLNVWVRSAPWYLISWKVLTRWLITNH